MIIILFTKLNVCNYTYLKYIYFRPGPPFSFIDLHLSAVYTRIETYVKRISHIDILDRWNIII
jgi:hypothetical protein